MSILKTMKEFICLTNHFLIAMPSMLDPHFIGTVTYIAEHNQDGALGIVINRPIEQLLLSEILKQMDIILKPNVINASIFYGGPVHQERGFVLHPPFGHWRSSFTPSEQIIITTSKDILEAIAINNGPEKSIIALGCAGWGAGQIEEEMKKNTWLSCEADPKIMFDMPYSERWQKAVNLLGIHDIHSLSGDVGHA